MPRKKRSGPRISDAKWAIIMDAAHQMGVEPGGFMAAAAEAAALADEPRAFVADYRRGVEELMESNRQLAAIGNNLNQLAHYLNVGGTPPADLRRLFERLHQAIDRVDAAAAHLAGR